MDCVNMDTDSDQPQTSSLTSPHAIHSPTEHIRNQNLLYVLRGVEQRAKTTATLRFGLGEVQDEVEELDEVTEQDVNELITRFKRRKLASAEELNKLSQALLQSSDNIDLVFNAPFVWPILIKEFTGIDPGRQVGAIECLCNLSLGDASVCRFILSQCGSVLVAYLDSLDERLKRTTLWMFANIVSTCPQAANILVQFDIIPKLFYIYINDAGDKNSEKDFREDAAVCLQILVMGKDKAARKQDIIFIKNNMKKKKPRTNASEYHLKIIFHADIVNPRSELNIGQTCHIVNFILSNLHSTKDFGSISNRLRIVYSIRVLSNMIQCVPLTSRALKCLVSPVWKTTMEILINKIFNFGEDLLSLEVIYLIKNLVHHNNERPLCQLDKLQIPKIDYAGLLRKKYNEIKL